MNELQKVYIEMTLDFMRRSSSKYIKFDIDCYNSWPGWLFFFFLLFILWIHHRSILIFPHKKKNFLIPKPEVGNDDLTAVSHITIYFKVNRLLSRISHTQKFFFFLIFQFNETHIVRSLHIFSMIQPDRWRHIFFFDFKSRN